ncbi:HK97 family phage prohead protease [Salibacterium lacus]|uniref:HK97 family phage prohead protease n=1 Tax=Salibacterium lacus TaxID=1898109 RepID=A0ABW5SYW3_9BACI
MQLNKIRKGESMPTPLELRSATAEKLEERSFDMTRVETREEDGKNIVAGYAAEFEKMSVPIFGFREKIKRGAFSKSLSDNTVKALWNHNTDMVLGSTKTGTLRLNEDERGLAFELDMPDTSWGRDAFSSIKRGDVDGVSFGFRVIQDEWDHSDPDEAIRTLVEVQLHEISPTGFPAYPQTSVSARSVLGSVGIDFDGLTNVIKRSENGAELTKTDQDLIRSTVKVLNKYAGDVQEGAPADEQEAQERSIAMRKAKLKLLEVENDG